MTENNNLIVEDSIDIIAILKSIWIKRKLVYIVTSIFFIIGIIAALKSPIVYTSKTTFIPQVGEDLTSSKGLGSLSAITGINLGSNGTSSDSYLSPLLYFKLTDSEEFSYNIIEEEIINLNGNKLTFKEYILSNKSSFNFNLIGFIKKNTIGSILKDDNSVDNIGIREDYNFLSEEDFQLIHIIKSKFTVDVNETEGYIDVLATDKDPFVSTQLVRIVTKNLQSKIIELRTNKIKESLKYSKKQYDLKQGEFNTLQKKLAEFKDSNKNISTASFMSELQKLESEYRLQQNILINLASVYNNNKIKLNKDTPIFSVIDEVFVPNHRTKPNRTQIVLIYIFCGLIISIAYILCIDSLKVIIKQFN